MPFECGRGRTGLWPWQLQAESRGFCLCISDERIHWVKRSLGEQAVFDAFPSELSVGKGDRRSRVTPHACRTFVGGHAQNSGVLLTHGMFLDVLSMSLLTEIDLE